MRGWGARASIAVSRMRRPQVYISSRVGPNGLGIEPLIFFAPCALLSGLCKRAIALIAFASRA
jgi:hypothetical protein